MTVAAQADIAALVVAGRSGEIARTNDEPEAYAATQAPTYAALVNGHAVEIEKATKDEV